ncbi:MAG: M1 family metallopeptidase [Steroidobacteraceae bacterium]|nr:M1 family metallopeptidase [Nevskiaceae bacterium]MCP5360064.1 M1 family metallopeptidase [Nevskiaceae bacterium]MCP5466115.1 M1 family metallopeptidase [Nevskiaceae bacterium]
MSLLRARWAVTVMLLAAAGFGVGGALAAVADPHSLANLDAFRVRHLDLSLEVDFKARRLSGTVDLQVERLDAAAAELVLDSHDLVIRQVWWLVGGQPERELSFAKGAAVPSLGEPLRIGVPTGVRGETFGVRISYQTSPEAGGLQWLEPAQTAGRVAPFLFSQSQSIYARSWIPLQDSPSVRATFTARVHVPPGLRAVMGASNALTASTDGWYHFEMPQPIPSYLMAIAAGRLDVREIGPRTAVFAEPEVVAEAAYEFADTERMIEACERLYGPYRWGRYDLLILPPSFPYGGMENPRLSFITPTLLAGDRSLVATIAHELAHSWSGNLVTNATWRDFWLNEGFTTFLERRIVGALYGASLEAMEQDLGLQSLRRQLAGLPPRSQVLAIDLRGRSPEEGTTDVPYEKGRLFLDWIESRIGVAALDGLLRDWFESRAFQSASTEEFRDFLLTRAATLAPGALDVAQVDEWLYQPGLPAFAVLKTSDVLARIDAQREDWLAGRSTLDSLPVAQWRTQEWLHFLDGMPADLSRERAAQLETQFGLNGVRNAEIAFSWLRIAIRADYRPAWPRLEEYLVSIGRRKLIWPLYSLLVKTPDGRAFAQQVYARARPGYHPIAAASLDPLILGKASTP